MKLEGRRKSKNVIIDNDPDARSTGLYNPYDLEAKEKDIQAFRQRKMTRKFLEESGKRQVFRPQDSKALTKKANEFNREYNSQVTPGHWITKDKIDKQY